MAFRYIIIAAFLWTSAAHAGFQWVAPAADPTAEKLAAPHDAKQPGQDLSAEDMVNRIFDYEAGRLSARQMEAARLQQIEDAAQEITAQKKKLDQAIKDVKQHKEKATAAANGFTPYAAHLRPTDSNNVKATIPTGTTPLEAIAIDPTHKPTIGFGNDVPLAMAINDITPKAYLVSFDKSINPGVLVSWDGLHRPWQIVLAEMLGRYRLVGSVKNQTITVHRLPASASPLAINPMMAGTFGQGDHTLILDPMPQPQTIRNFAAVDPTAGLLPFAPRPVTPQPQAITPKPVPDMSGFEPAAGDAQTSSWSLFTPGQAASNPQPQAPQVQSLAPKPVLQDRKSSGVYISRQESRAIAEQRQKDSNPFYKIGNFFRSLGSDNL